MNLFHGRTAEESDMFRVSIPHLLIYLFMYIYLWEKLILLFPADRKDGNVNQ